MTNAVILVLSISVVCSGVLGYLLGRYNFKLIEEIEYLWDRRNSKLPPEPEKPSVVGGAYQPPKQVSSAVDNKAAAGIVETKTPQQLDWENQNELHKLETS